MMSNGSSRNLDLWRSLPNASRTSVQQGLLRRSQELKSPPTYHLYSPTRGNTPVGFDRIYNGKSLAKQQESLESSPKAFDTLKKLRKEQYMATMKHNFSIMGASVDLKKPRRLRQN